MNIIRKQNKFSDHNISKVIEICFKIISDKRSLFDYISELDLEVDENGSGLDRLADGCYNFGTFDITILTEDHIITAVRPYNTKSTIIKLSGGASQYFENRYTDGINVPDIISSSFFEGSRLNTEGFAYYHSWKNDDFTLLYSLLITVVILLVLSYSKFPRTAVLGFAEHTGLNKFGFGVKVIRSAKNFFKIVTVRGSSAASGQPTLESAVNEVGPSPEVIPQQVDVTTTSCVDTAMSLGHMKLLTIRSNVETRARILYFSSQEALRKYLADLEISQSRLPSMGDKVERNFGPLKMIRNFGRPKDVGD